MSNGRKLLSPLQGVNGGRTALPGSDPRSPRHCIRRDDGHLGGRDGEELVRLQKSVVDSTKIVFTEETSGKIRRALLRGDA